MSIEAMKQALEALEKQHNWMVANGGAFAESSKKAIFALEKAIEQAEKKEPMAWFIQYEYRYEFLRREPTLYERNTALEVIPLYSAPVHAIDTSQERVDETAKDRHDLTCVCGAVWVGEEMVCSPRKRQWVGLTDEEVGGLTVFDGLTHIEVPILADFVRAVEAKLKENNS